MDSPVTIDDATRRNGVLDRATSSNDGDRLKRRAKRFGILAVIACPCHLPLVATVLAFVGFGGSAAALRDNLLAVSVIFGAVAVASLWFAIRSSRTANVCRLPPPPAQRRPMSSSSSRGHNQREVDVT
jgi:hypothetical protein